VQHDVVLADQQKAQLEGLPSEWDLFQQVLSTSVGTLDQAKDAFKEKVKGLVDMFNDEVASISQAFLSCAPFSQKDFTTQQACIPTIHVSEAACATLAENNTASGHHVTGRPAACGCACDNAVWCRLLKSLASKVSLPQMHDRRLQT
jgi:hypothetical protein